MKAGLKKLRTCAFSKARASREFFSTQTQYNRRLVCDHPEMKEHWSEETCVNCSSYRNRNQEDNSSLEEQKKEIHEGARRTTKGHEENLKEK